MKLYRYHVIFDDIIGDIKIDNFEACEAEIFDKSLIKRNVSSVIITIYKFVKDSYIKLVPDVVINSVAFPMVEGALRDGKPSYYCIFTDNCDTEKNLKLFKELKFYNTFLEYTNVYGAN